MALGKKNKQDRLATAHQWVAEAGGNDFSVLSLPKGVQIWNPKEEKVYNVTIVPYEVTDEINKYTEKRAAPGQLYYERSFMAHRNIGPEGDKKSYVCSAKTTGKPCEICNWLNKQYSPDLDKESIEALDKMVAKSRQLWNVLVHEEKDKGVQLMEISYHLFGKYLQEKIKKSDPDKREKYMRFHDPDRGYNLRLAPTAKSFGKANYLEFNDIEFKLRKEPLKDSLIAKACDLDAVLKIVDGKKLKEVLAGGAEEEAEEKPNKKKRPKDEEEDDDDDTNDEEADDEDDDSEEDEDEPEEDEDESENGDDSEDDESEESGDEDDDGDSDDDSVLEEDEEKEDAEEPLAKGDKCSFMRKGKRKIGVIKKVDEEQETYLVKIADVDRLIPVAFDEATRAGELKPKKSKAPPALDDEDDDDLPVKKPVKIKNKPGKKKRPK